MRTLIAVLVLCAAGTARADAVDELVGTWDVTLHANYSTCAAASVGDQKAEQWTVSTSAGSLKVNVSGGDNTTKSYSGSAKDDGTIVLAAEGSEVGVELKGKGGKLAGRRVVARPSGSVFKKGACAIVYDVTAKKQK